MTENKRAETRVSVRLDHDELEQVKEFVAAQGFDTVAAWFRSVTGLDERRLFVGKVTPNEEADRDESQ